MLERFFEALFYKEPLTKLGRALQELEKIDLQLIREEKEIQEESKILPAKHYFFKPRIMDWNKINAVKIDVLHNHLNAIVIQEAIVKKALHDVENKIEKKKIVLDSYQQKIFVYLRTNINFLFIALQRAGNISEEIREYLQEFTPQELADDLILLNKELEQIRVITRQLVWAIEYLVRRRNPYLPATEIVKTEQYRKDVFSYPNKKAEILETETKIETAPAFLKKLHEPLKHTKWKGHLHARVDLNLRIIYSWDAKKQRITYERLVKHTEIEL